MALTDTYTLSNGVKIPVVGFGTWQTPSGDVAYHAVLDAIKAAIAISIPRHFTVTKKVLAKPFTILV